MFLLAVIVTAALLGAGFKSLGLQSAQLMVGCLAADEQLALLTLEQLADGVSRQHIDDGDVMRLLEAGQPTGAVADDAVAVQRLARLEHQHAQANLAPLVAGHHDHGGVSHLLALGDFKLGVADDDGSSRPGARQTRRSRRSRGRRRAASPTSTCLHLLGGLGHAAIHFGKRASGHGGLLQGLQTRQGGYHLLEASNVFRGGSAAGPPGRRTAGLAGLAGLARKSCA